MDDDLLKRETERQRRLLEEARKAVEADKERMRQGGVHKVELRLDESDARAAMAADPLPKPFHAQSRVQPMRGGEHVAPMMAGAGQSRSEHIACVRKLPDIRSALVPLDESREGGGWSKPFSLPKADMEPWVSFLRGYRESSLFPYAASADRQPGRELEVDAAVQALFELKQIDLKRILDPAVQINGPVEYLDEIPAGAPNGETLAVHRGELAKAVEKGRRMGNHLYDALLGEGYANLAQAWEKVYGRKPTVSELHSMLTTGRVQPSAEERPPTGETAESAMQPTFRAAFEEFSVKKSAAAQEKKNELSASHGSSGKLPENRAASTKKFSFPDKRKMLFHVFHAAVICAFIAAYFLIMRVIN